MRFQAKVIPSGNATGVEVPDDARRALGPQARPLVVITINDHTWRSRIALMRGMCLIGISAANRAAAGIVEGDMIDVELVADEEPRQVSEPQDFSDALDRHPDAKATFERLPFGLKTKHVRSIEEAKTAAVRQRRIDALVTALRWA